ncbi:MAG: hypothetical protein ACYTFI_09850 [Planctomycetota bacterium]|jgi:hypothetical protein
MRIMVIAVAAFVVGALCGVVGHSVARGRADGSAGLPTIKDRIDRAARDNDVDVSDYTYDVREYEGSVVAGYFRELEPGVRGDTLVMGIRLCHIARLTDSGFIIGR